jgi:uracil phosphoribosyltransferase
LAFLQNFGLVVLRLIAVRFAVYLLPMVHHICKSYSIVSDYVRELRDITIQQDRMRFRKNMHRIASCIGYELSKHLATQQQEISTPLGVYAATTLAVQPVIGTILRAGVPMFEGLLDTFDGADCCFVAAYRKHSSEESFVINQEYVTCPDLTGRDLIIADPMLATGASLVQAIKELKDFGEPRSIHIVCAIASTIGLELVMRELGNIHIWVADIDDELTAKGYIVPGLGDAGDLSYGSKLQM